MSDTLPTTESPSMAELRERDKAAQHSFEESCRAQESRLIHKLGLTRSSYQSESRRGHWLETTDALTFDKEVIAEQKARAAEQRRRIFAKESK